MLLFTGCQGQDARQSPQQSAACASSQDGQRFMACGATGSASGVQYASELSTHAHLMSGARFAVQGSFQGGLQ